MAILDVETELRRDHRGKPILLAEDDLLNQQLALEILREVELDPTLACDGDEAIILARRHEYALILMDMHMPRCSGIQATVAIRGLPDRQNVPILGLTATTSRQDRAACLDAGMNEIIAKPLVVDHLYAALLKWLRR